MLLVNGAVVGARLRLKFLDYPLLYLLLAFLRRSSTIMPFISDWKKSIVNCD